MKIIVDVKRFVSAAEWTIRVSPVGSILMKVIDDSTVLLRSEGDEGMRSASLSVRIEDRDDSVYAFSSLHLSKLIAALTKKHSDGSAEITLHPHTAEAQVVYENLHFPVSLLTASGRIPSDGEQFHDLGSVDYTDFMDALRSADRLTGNELKSTSMTNITFDTDVIKIVGTDKYVLGVFSVGFNSIKHLERTQFLIVPDINNLKTECERISISESDESMKLDFENGKIATVRKQQGRPMPWKRAIDAELLRRKNASDGARETVISANIRDLMTSCDIAISLTPSSDNIDARTVILRAKEGKIVVSSTNENSPTDSIDTDYQGDEKIIWINYNEVKKALSSLSTNDIHVRYVNSDLALIITEPARAHDTTDSNVFLLINPSSTR